MSLCDDVPPATVSFPRLCHSRDCVIPAKAGIHPDMLTDLDVELMVEWIPAFAGMTQSREGHG